MFLINYFLPGFYVFSFLCWSNFGLGFYFTADTAGSKFNCCYFLSVGNNKKNYWCVRVCLIWLFFVFNLCGKVVSNIWVCCGYSP